MSFILFRLQCSTFLEGRPGWNPFKHSPGDDIEEDEDEDDGTTFTVLKRVDLPPQSLQCIHQKTGLLECKCNDAALPDGFNIQIRNDKVRRKNR